MGLAREAAGDTISVMNRRNYIRAMAAAGAAASVPVEAATDPIHLHVDLDVEPTKQKDLVMTFKNVFKPTIGKQPGFVEVKLLKLRQAMKGPAPANASYRLLISFQTEEQRKTWVATDDHQRVWPQMEKNLRGEKFGAVLYDVL
jgi:heme-degrading monooxygenase HmoA